MDQWLGGRADQAWVGLVVEDVGWSGGGGRGMVWWWRTWVGLVVEDVGWSGGRSKCHSDAPST